MAMRVVKRKYWTTHCSGVNSIEPSLLVNKSQGYMTLVSVAEQEKVEIVM